MKIAILGGGFDPPHIGHLFIAIQVKEILNMDQVWFMPSYKHPFGKKLSRVEDRMNMLTLLNNDFLKVSDHEIKKKGCSYSIDTLNDLSGQYPDNKFSWIVGSDNLKDFPKWKNWQEILEKYHLIVFPRDLKQGDFKQFRNITFLKRKDLFTTDVNSTIIRNRVQTGKSIKYFVPDKIEKYIIKHKLYVSR